MSAGRETLASAMAPDGSPWPTRGHLRVMCELFVRTGALHGRWRDLCAWSTEEQALLLAVARDLSLETREEGVYQFRPDEHLDGILDGILDRVEAGVGE